MSCNLNSRIVDLVAPAARSAEFCGQPGKKPKNARQIDVGRRQLVLALAGAPLLAFASNDPTAGLQRWGSGQFRRFGFLVYEATLWAAADPLRPPLALRLDYKRTIAGSAIAEASVKEMARFAGKLAAEPGALQRWGEQMSRLFPDVREGDHILGVYLPDRAGFLFNGRPLGEIVDAEFARRFFAIWLDPQTSAPDLRAALLQRPG
jgi:hypothetical protein